MNKSLFMAVLFVALLTGLADADWQKAALRSQQAQHQVEIESLREQQEEQQARQQAEIEALRSQQEELIHKYEQQQHEMRMQEYEQDTKRFLKDIDRRREQNLGAFSNTIQPRTKKVHIYYDPATKIEVISEKELTPEQLDEAFDGKSEPGFVRKNWIPIAIVLVMVVMFGFIFLSTKGI